MRAAAAVLVGQLLAACTNEDAPAPGETLWTLSDDRGPEADRALDVAVEPEGRLVVVGFLGLQPGPDAETRGFVWGLESDGSSRFELELPDDRSLVSGVAIDPAGRVAVTGAVQGVEDGWGWWTASYEPDGALRWEHRAEGPVPGGEDQGVGVTVDDEGRLFVAGYQQVDETTTDACIRMYEPDGAPGWERCFDGPASDIDVATDITWSTERGVLGVVGYQSIDPANTDVWVTVLDGAGEQRWSATVAGLAGVGDRGTSLAFGPAGDLFVGGIVAIPGRTVDGWLGRFDVGGRLLWSVEHDGPASLGDGINDLAVDDQGRPVVGGYEYVEPGKWDVWVAAFETDGTPRWTHRYGAPAQGDDLGSGVAIDQDTVVVAGSIGTGDDARSIWLRKLGL